MNTLVALIVVLGVFWSPALATFQVYRIPSSNGEYVQQTVTIDSENQVANIHVYGGICSSDTILDYNTGYIAVRIFSRRACFVMKMGKDYILELEDIGRLAYEKQMMKEVLSPKIVWGRYEPSNSFGKIKEWFVFGHNIEKLCKDVPVYKVVNVASGIHVGSCVKASILGILDISICGDIDL